MRRIPIAFAVVSVFAAGMYAQSDPLTAIREALTAQYKLTSITADKTTIVITGSRLTLNKSDLPAADGTSAVVLSSSYKNGKISRGLMGQMARGASGTRTFVAGEKLWVTKIEVKPKGITFRLESDEYSDVRYRAELNFPFEKRVPPSPAEALAMVGEVLAVEDPPPATAAYPEPEPKAEPSAAQEIHNWDSRYGRFTKDDLERINDATVRFDLNYLRLNPAALEQKPVMQYFIMLNNCNDRDIERSIYNELDYPALAVFYRSKAGQILEPLPRTVTDVALYRFIGGQQSGNWRLWTQSLSLGEYNPQRKAFPLKYPGKDSVGIADLLSADSSRRDLMKTCPAAAKAAGAATQYFATQYLISIKPAEYKELPMEEDAARTYIDNSRGQRNVFLAVDVTILDSPPVIETLDNSSRKATFRAQTTRIRVIDGNTLKPLGALYDDHTLPAEVQATQQQQPAAPKSGNQWAFGDHMYEIRQAVYISLAADACSWPMTPEQTANLSTFLQRVRNGNFNERYQYNLVHARIKNAISAKGRANYCADRMERRDFDKAAATVAPLGPIAASASK